MSTMLDRFNDDERLAATREDFKQRALAMVQFGLVSREENGSYDVEELGFGRPSAIVSADYRHCSACDGAICLHREAARLFVERPQPTPARREDDVRGPNVATSMSQLVTPRQLVCIRIKCAALGLNAEAESVRLLGARPEYLTRKAAGRMIQWLEGQGVRR